MSDYSLSVEGTTYYFTSKAEFEEVKKADTNEAKKELIAKYSSGQNPTVSTNEDDLVEINEAGEEAETASTTGLDYNIYKSYAQATGLTELNEDSSVKDLIAVFENIEADVKDLELQIQTMDASNPNEIDSVFAQLTCVTNAINSLGSSAGLNLPTKNNGLKIATGVGVTAVAVAGGCAAATGVAMASAGIVGASSLLGGISVAAAAVPVAGWVVAGVAGVAALATGIFGYFKNKNAEKQFDQLKQDMQDTANKMLELQNTATEKFDDKVNGEVIPKIEKQLNGLLEDSFSFDENMSASTIQKNIEKIIACQQTLEPYATVAKKYGLEIDGLEELSQKLGTGDDALTYAQDYLDAYAESVEISLTEDAVSDTKSLTALYDSITEIIESAQAQGLDTTSLEELLVKISEENQKEADEAGEKYSASASTSTSSDSVVDSVQSSWDSSQTASTTGSGISENASSYQVSTSSLEEASKTLADYAQSSIESYAEEVAKINSSSITELQEKYEEIETTAHELETISSELDISGVREELERIRQQQELIIQQRAEIYAEQTQNLETSAGGQEIVNNINIDITNAQEAGCDTSALTQALENLTQKVDELIEKEQTPPEVNVNVNVDVNNNLNNNIDLNNNIGLNNSVEINNTNNVTEEQEKSEDEPEEEEKQEPVSDEKPETPPCETEDSVEMDIGANTFDDLADELEKAEKELEEANNAAEQAEVAADIAEENAEIAADAAEEAKEETEEKIQEAQNVQEQAEATNEEIQEAQDNAEDAINDEHVKENAALQADNIAEDAGEQQEIAETALEDAQDNLDDLIEIEVEE